MTVVGSAHVVIRGITDKLGDDIQKALNDAVPQMNTVGQKMGRNLGDSISKNIAVDPSNIEQQVNQSTKRAGAVGGKNISSGINRGTRQGGNNMVAMFGGFGGRAGSRFTSAFNRGGGPSRIFIGMALRISALLPIFGALIGSIGAVVNGLFAMGAAAANSVYSVTALGGALAALVQGAIVGMVAFQGIGAAVTAGMKPAVASTQAAQKKLGDSAQDAAKRVRNAAEAVADAERDSARAIRDAIRGVRDAKQALKDTYWETARAQRDAVESVTDAEEAHRDSVEALDDAQRTLNEAYEEAKDRLQDLQFSQREGVIAEQRAVMELQDALYRLHATEALPADNRTRQQAILDYQEAQLNLEEIQANNANTAEDLAGAQDAAAESISDAQEDVSDAQEDSRDSARDYNDALEDQIRLQGINARAIRDSKEALQAAKEALADAYREGPRAIRDAKEALEAAGKAQTAANDALAAGVPVANAFQDAMDKLSPAAQHFVRYLLSIRGELQSLKFAAQEGLFPGLEKALRTLVEGPLFPALRTAMFQTGQAIGQATVEIAEAMSSGPFVASFGRVAEFNAKIIEQFGRILGDLIVVVFRLLDAARPLTQRFVDWVEAVTSGWRATLETKKGMNDLRNTLNESGDTMAQLWQITKNLWEGIKDLGHVAKPAGKSLLDSFEGATKAFADFTDTKAKRQELRQTFQDTADNLRAIGDLILVIGGSFTRMGANPAIARTMKELEPVVRNIEELLTGMLERSGDDLTALIDSIVTAFDEISKSGGFETFLTILTTSVNLLTAAFRTPILGDGLSMLVKIGAAMYALSIIRSFPGISLFIRMIGKSAVGAMIKFNAQMVLMIIKQAAWNAITAVGAGIARAFSIAVKLINAAFKANPIGVVITAIALLVAGLILAYKKSETFRNIVNWVWDALKKLWGVLMDNKQLFALLLGPIGLIIIGFKALYDHVGWFRDAVNGAFGFVVDAVKWLGDAFKWLWDLLFGNSIFPDIVAGILWAAKMIQGYFDLIMAGVHLLGDVFTWLWDNAIKPAWDLIVAGIGFYWDGIQLIFDTAIGWIKTVFGAAWGIVKDKIINPIGNAKDRLGEIFGPGGPIRGFFSGVKDWVVTKFAQAWSAIKDKILKPIADARDAIKNFFGEGGPIRTAFNDVKTWALGKFATAWDAVKGAIKDPIDKAVSAIKGFLSAEKNGLQWIFQQAVNGIGAIWGGLKALAKAPVRFIIQTVYNDGLRKALNLIPGVDLEEAKLPEGFASGGVLPGWSPGRDIHQFYSPTAGRLNLSGGEAIMRPEFTRAVGGETGVEQLNRLARGVNAGRLKPQVEKILGRGYASGGVFPLPGGSVTGVHTTYGHYAVDINKGSGYDDYGLPVLANQAGAVSQHYIGDASYGRWVTIAHDGGGSSLYAHLSAFGATGHVNAGTMIGKVGDIGNTGTPPTSHLHFELSSGSLSGASNVAAGPTPAQVEAQNEGDSWKDLITKFPDAIKGAVSNIKNMSDKFGAWGSMYESAMGEVGKDMIQWVNDKIPDKIPVPKLPDIPLPKNPISNPFDNGGVASGEGWMAKGTVKPERVLSPRQTEAFERLVGVLDGMSATGAKTGGGDVNLTVQVPPDASARDVVNEITYELRRLRRGGRYT